MSRFFERVDERVVLLAGALDPDHVVEEQVVLVARGEPLELEARPVHEHRVQDADFRVDAVGLAGGRVLGGHRLGGASRHGGYRPALASGRAAGVSSGAAVGPLSLRASLDWLHLR